MKVNDSATPTATQKKLYVAPSFVLIGSVVGLTGSNKNLDYLDNNNVAAWKSVRGSNQP